MILFSWYPCGLFVCIAVHTPQLLKGQKGQERLSEFRVQEVWLFLCLGRSAMCPWWACNPFESTIQPVKGFPLPCFVLWSHRPSISEVTISCREGDIQELYFHSSIVFRAQDVSSASLKCIPQCTKVFFWEMTECQTYFPIMSEISRWHCN